MQGVVFPPWPAPRDLVNSANQQEIRAMQAYEYKVVPAPAKGTKAKGVRSPEGRFSNSIELLLNEMAAGGWEFQRAELLPSTERSGLTGSTTNWRNVMVFRRSVAAEAPAMDEADQLAAAAAQPAPAEEGPTLAPVHEPELVRMTATAGDPEASPEATPVPGPGAKSMLADDGVEELSPVSGLTAALKARAQQKSVDSDKN